MKSIRVIAVHPALTVIESDGQKIEIPTSWFPARPAAGQVWSLGLTHEPTEQEQRDELNKYIA